MTRYYRGTHDPQRLLARERAPVSGRRVPKARSKRVRNTPVPRPRRLVPVVAFALIALLAGTGAVLAMRGRSRSVEESVGTVDEESVVPVGEPAPSPTSTVLAAAAPSAPSGPSTTRPPDTAITTGAVLPTTPPLDDPTVRLTVAAAATAATVTPTDPGASASFTGPLPVFDFALDCMRAGCSFSMRVFAPGTVTDEGLTSVPATAGRFLVSSTRPSTCTTAGGDQLSRDVSTVIDLTLSGTQTVDRVPVPRLIAGTLTTVTPDVGYVPKVGDVVQEGVDRGCAGQVVVFDVSGPLLPG